VALKFISKAKKTEKEVRSLRREIDIMRSLRHPNIVQMLDSFDTQHDIVVVTEFAQGELFQILQDDRTLPEYQVSSWLCAGLLCKGKGKVFPYSLPSVGPGADPGVQAVSPQVT